IHVAGTNGKGSTVQFLAEMMAQAGHDVGTFTSPSLQHLTERIALNGKSIPDDTFVEIANTVRPLVEQLAQTEYGPATEFEVITMIAIIYFAIYAYTDMAI